ncbi:MAG TPA: hypothetical protein VN918_08240 [Myxococcaceae bacterium]|nr:hypothetical protein [Myxococcaceae bacterium]
MMICTYRERFQAELEKMIALGGDVGSLVTLVNAYQGRDPSARTVAFREWLENDLFFCERCWHEFKADAAEVDEDDKVLCSACAWRVLANMVRQ